MVTDAFVLVPGVMGSELYDDGKLIWGLKPSILLRHRRLRRILERLAIDDEDDEDRITPGAPVTLPAWLPMLDGLEPYQLMTNALRTLAHHPSAVLEFGYDWRRSIEHNAARLKTAATQHLTAWRNTYAHLDTATHGDEPRLTFICHSMGGLVARWFATFHDPDEATRRIITLGTPFAGAVKAARMIADGDMLPFGLLSEPLRAAARTMPGIHDLLPTYRCVGPARHQPQDGAETFVRPTLQDFINLGATDTLARDALARRHRVDTSRPARAEIRSLVGVNQSTWSSWSPGPNGPTFSETHARKEPRGDGTVFAASAFLAGQVPGGYLPQKHGTLANTEEARAFVRAVLAEDELRRWQAAEGPGLVTPSAAQTGEPFDVEVIEWDGDSIITIEDAETGRHVDRLRPIRRDGRRLATADINEVGLYRFKLTAGGFSDVTELVGVLDTAEASDTDV